MKECSYLAKEKHFEVHLIAPNTVSHEKNLVKIHGINYSDKENRMNRIFKLRRVLYEKAIKIDADLYHFHDPELIPIGKKLKRKGKLVIYDSHEDVPRQILTKHWIPPKLRKIVSYVYEKYENISSKKFDSVIGATPHITSRFESLDCKNVTNINNFPILNDIYPKVNYNLTENAVVYIGGITKSRGISEMILATSKANVKLYLGGRFPDDGERKSMEELNEWSSVDFLGYIDREKIQEVFSKSLAGLVILHPTENYLDSLPVKMFEYMAAGLPVIASDFPIWEKIIEANNCGICVNPENTNEIVQAIEYLVKNPKIAIEMGENGRRAVETKFNWENENKNLVTLYKKLESNLISNT